MVPKIIEWLEVNVEKIVMGVAGLFTLTLIWMFLLNSPNRIELGGQPIAPGELNSKILTDAQGLQAAVRNAKPEETETETFAEKLRKQFTGGIAATAGPGPDLNADLRVVSPFGTPIQVPGLEETEEPAGSVTLVTPLAPSRPVVATGRSMAFRAPLNIALVGDTAATPRPPEPPGGPGAAATPKPVELPWVTVAAYYDSKAQYQEMTKAGYIAYRARPYVVALEVERQEMQSTGEWSEWSAVRPGDAMPKFDVPAAEVDDASGKLLNKKELDAAFRTIKAEQWRLIQPPFYAVDAGDPWDWPPLPGLEKPAAPGATAPGGPQLPVPPQPTGTIREPAPPPTPQPGPRPGPGVRPPPVRDDTANLVRELNLELKRAQEAFSKKEYQEAIRVAEGIQNNAGASIGQKKRAARIVTSAQSKLAKAAGRSGYVDRATLPPTQAENPDTQAPAIWFHDDTVESGKTYRYRMRVALWNRYVGQARALKDPAQARETVIRGDWSQPSAPVTVTPTTHFFVKGAAPSGGTVKFGVWKWSQGNWVEQAFDVAVGDVIGGPMRVKTDETDDNLKPIYADLDFTTGAVVLDVRSERIRERIPGQDSFSYREQPSVVVVFLDPADGQVKEKSQTGDKNDPIRQSLEDDEG